MKIGEILRNDRGWKELFNLTTELLDAGKNAHDGGLYMAGLRLSRIVSHIANIDIDIDKEEGGVKSE